MDEGTRGEHEGKRGEREKGKKKGEEDWAERLESRY